MDLTSAISNFQQANVIGQVQYAVAKKVLDAQRSDGAAALQMVQAASANFDKAGDQLVAAATGLGGSLDTYA